MEHDERKWRGLELENFVRMPVFLLAYYIQWSVWILHICAVFIIKPDVRDESCNAVSSSGECPHYVSGARVTWLCHYTMSASNYCLDSKADKKGRYSSSWEPHLKATGRHLPYGIRITQCYLPTDTSEHIPPNPSHAGWYLIYLPRRDGRLGWPILIW